MPTLLTDCATVEDFKLAFGDDETLALANVCNPLDITFDQEDEVKIQFAIDRAIDTINSRYVIAGDCGRALIKISCRQLTLDIARFYLDTAKQRPFVTENYDRSHALIDYACDQCNKCPLTEEELQDILGEDYICKRSKYRGYAGRGTQINTSYRKKFTDYYEYTSLDYNHYSYSYYDWFYDRFGSGDP